MGSEVERFGTSGRRVPATVNVFHLPMSWPNGQQIFHYSVFEPKWTQATPIKIGVAKNREIIARLQTDHSNVFQPVGAYDGKANLFSFGNYDFSEREFTVHFDPHSTRPNRKEVSVTLKLVRAVDLDLLRQLNSPKFKKQVNEAASSVLNLLNVFIQSEPKTAYPSLYGKNTVFSSRGQKDTRSVAPLELWMGIFQSVRPAMDKIVINIDTTVGVVVPKNALEDFCWTYCRNTFNMNNRKLWQLNPSEFQELRTFARDIKITIKTAGRPARSVKIKDLVKDCGEVRFLKKITGNQTVEMTVADHFFHVHNITIPPRSLGVKVGHNEVFPISICTTVNQLYKNKLPPQYTAHTLKFLPANPEARLKKIEDAWQHLEYKNSQFLQGGNINFNPSSSALCIIGRLLPAPKIKTQWVDNIQPGVWDVQQKRLREPATIKRWSCINCAPYREEREIKAFMRELKEVMEKRGISNDPHYVLSDGMAIENLLSSNPHRDANLIVVVLPDQAAPLYTRVKRCGDILVGVPIQCIRWSSKLSQGTRNSRNQYQNNVILKINARLGGVNFIPEDSDGHKGMAQFRAVPTMVLGADVSHPSSGSTSPSIAALVSSWDTGACRYIASVRVQRSRMEIIEDLETMVIRAIKIFTKYNKMVPVRLLYFRDGVSESQFDAVLDLEGKAIQNAVLKFLHLYGHHRPAITFIICGKKHHIRFFPDCGDAEPRNKNFPAGFVGDRDIGHPVFTDFYLQSQKGLQGTSRPCHYTLLRNDRNEMTNTRLTMDEIQQIAFGLCHCYARATRSVKIPAPVYYADLVCGRARFHYDLDLDSSSVSSEDPDDLLEFYQQRFDPVHQRLAETMYFV